MFLLPQVAYAMPENANQLVRSINEFIINPIIVLLFIVAMVYFLWGLIAFIKDSGSADGRTKGGDHIMWGLIGMFIMVSVFFILNLLMNTFGVTNINLQPGPGDDFVTINPSDFN
jgi:hypothetical protein